jgi:predicted membrane-bound spermidine synthase
VARNFLLSALLVGLGLARVTVDGLFAHLQPAGVAYVLFIGGVLCPVAWLLGQTVPVLTNLMKHMRTGEASGYALYWSTLGSFLGSVSLSLLVMQWLGVSVAVLVCALLLAVGSLLLAEAGWRRWGAAVAAGLVATAINLFAPSAVVDTAYADYAVEGVSLPDHADPRAFFVNNSLASLVDDSTPPRYARYVQHLRKLLLEDLAFKGRSVLVLGAGGFTLSHQEPVNRYTYVDIDPKIREIAETRFLRAPIRGEFVVDDARRYVRATAERYDAVVVDVFSSHTSIPGHLVTREFWQDTRRALAPDGVLLANLILDGKLETPYARNLLATIESVFGRCGVDVLHRGKPLSNVVVSCYASSQPGAITPYSDERNGADLDLARSR